MKEVQVDQYYSVFHRIADELNQKPHYALHPSQIRVILSIPSSEVVPMRHVAESLGCHASNITGLVDRLEKQELVERVSCPKDRRVKYIQLTTQGKKVQKDANKLLPSSSIKLENLKKLVDSLTGEQKDFLRELLQEA